MVALPLYLASGMMEASEEMKEGTIDVGGVEVFRREYIPAGKANATMLLLHGAAFTSKTWKDLGTLSKLQEAGVRAFAVDLPGFGESSGVSVPDRAEFLKSLVEFVGGNIKIIIAPSMSGSFAHPYLQMFGEEIDGYVPVAPVSVSSFDPPEAVREKLLVLAVAGENDKGGVQSLTTFESLFPNIKKLVIPNGSHPAYLDNPELWHEELIKFVSCAVIVKEGTSSFSDACVQ